MEKLHKETKFLLFLSIFYPFIITLTALVFSLFGDNTFHLASLELIEVSSEIVSMGIIFSVFAEIFKRRFTK